ncbi:hypothetical protein AX334_18005 [Salmonella enterica]|nr:hypothetical protein [Salmonella enterica]EBB7877037.1 hypothetical protein [Salmonella enterica]
MTACLGISSCLSSTQQITEDTNTYKSYKQESLGDYSIHCYRQDDIRPVNRGEPKRKMTAKELVDVRSLCKELGVTKNPYQDPKVTSNNCGMPRFPLN